MACILVLQSKPNAQGYYRGLVPARILARLGHEVMTGPPEKAYKQWMKPTPQVWFERHAGQFDLVLAERLWDMEELGLIRGFVANSKKARLIIDFDDDFHNIPWWNQAQNSFQPGQVCRQVGDMTLKLAEYCTVTCDHLADAFRAYTHRLAVTPNFIDPADWHGHPEDPDRPSDPHVRIYYGGAGQHYGDLDDVRSGLEAFLRKPPVPVRLVCFGTIPRWLHDIEREVPGRVVGLPWVPFLDYPPAVAWGGFDFSIAPLADHPFNLSKSAIKWVEATVQGFPLLASRVGPYAALPAGTCLTVDNNHTEWQAALEELTTNAILRRSLLEAAQAEAAAHHTLDYGAEVWQTVIEQALQAPRIESVEDTRLPREQKWQAPQA
jgi:glycosyltransferase involved in cell wall biosynthesis